MNKRISPFESQIENDLLLKNTGFLENTDPLLSLIEDYSPLLSCALPIPDCNETLLIYQSKEYHCTNQTLTTLRNEQKFHNFLDYTSLSRALKRFSCFRAKSFPIVSLSAALFPLGRARHATWINPFKIVELKEEGPFSLVRLMDGPTIKLDVSTPLIRKRSEECLCILATLQRDYLIPGHTGPRSPLDVLHFPNTPFLRSIIQQPLLQQFPLPIRALKEAYEKEYALQTILQLGHSGELDQWVHAAFYDSFTK